MPTKSSSRVSQKRRIIYFLSLSCLCVYADASRRERKKKHKITTYRLALLQTELDYDVEAHVLTAWELEGPELSDERTIVSGILLQSRKYLSLVHHRTSHIIEQQQRRVSRLGTRYQVSGLDVERSFKTEFDI